MFGHSKVAFDDAGFRVLRVETLVVDGGSLLVCGVLCWSSRSTSHTIRTKLLICHYLSSCEGVSHIFKIG